MSRSPYLEPLRKFDVVAVQFERLSSDGSMLKRGHPPFVKVLRMFNQWIGRVAQVSSEGSIMNMCQYPYL
eukprot:7536332-Pyramimonas_sp.AAC.1